MSVLGLSAGVSAVSHPGDVPAMMGFVRNGEMQRGRDKVWTRDVTP